MMPSTPVPRRHMHKRRIESDGFRRDDGLWDIEASIIDTKGYAYTEPHRGVRTAGNEVHHMAIRLTLDEQMVVQAIEVTMPATPYPSCQGALEKYQRLVGRTVARGWRRAILEIAGGMLGCTHVSDLLIVAGTTAFQTVKGWPENGPVGAPPLKMPPEFRSQLIDSCIGLAAGGEGETLIEKFYGWSKDGNSQ